MNYKEIEQESAMMTLFKTILITLTFRFISISCMATESIYEDSVGDDKRSKKAEQITEERSVSSQQLVFLGETLLNIGLYLGRQEVGRLEQVSRGINSFFTQRLEGLRLYESYAHQLHLEKDSRSIADKNDNEINWGERIKILKKQIAGYYELSIFSIINNDLNFMDIDITCSNYSGSVLAGFFNHDGGSNKRTAVIWKDDEIKPLELLHNGCWSMATAINADGSIIVGWATDSQNDDNPIAVMWKGERIQRLPSFNNEYQSMATAISADGTVIAGFGKVGQNANIAAFMWKEGRLQCLPSLNNGYRSMVKAISEDGTIIMGRSKDGYDENISTSVLWGHKGIRRLEGHRSDAVAINADATIIAGYAADQDSNALRAVKWKNEKIEYLPSLNTGPTSEATSISADGIIVAGYADDDCNTNKVTAVIWKGQKIIPLKNYQFKQSHDYLEKVILVSKYGSEFIIKSNTNETYKAHIPRDDLWKMS